MAIGVRIAGQDITTLENSVNISERVNERSSASLVAQSKLSDSVRIKKRDTVVLYDTVTTDVLFAGFVDKVKEKQIGQTGAVRNHSIICVDNHYLADKRIVAAAFENKTVTQILTTLLNGKAAEEGIHFTADSIDGGDTVNVFATTFNYQSLSKVFDKLAERAACDWWIDKDRKFWFKRTGAVSSGLTVDDSMVFNAGLAVEQDAHQYRNKQYIRGGRGTTDIRTETYNGDGKRTTFTVGFPLAKKPALTVNSIAVDEALVGVKGVDADNGYFHWFWAKNSTEVIAAYSRPKLQATDVLQIDYQGYYSIVVVSQESNQIGQLGTQEGTSGIVESMDTEVNLDNKDEIYEVANSKIRRYAQENGKVTAVVMDSRFHAGQLVNVSLTAEDIVDTDYLVESVDVFEQYPQVCYKLVLVKGYIHSTWAQLFSRLNTDTTDAKEDNGLLEVVILPASKTKTWLNSENPNTMRDTVVGAGVRVGTVKAFPMFNNENRNTVMHVYDAQGQQITAVNVAKRTYTENTIVSLFIVPTSQGQGDWAEIGFNSGAGGQVQTVTFPEVRSKTIYDEVQMELTDIKGWEELAAWLWSDLAAQTWAEIQTYTWGDFFGM